MKQEIKNTTVEAVKTGSTQELIAFIQRYNKWRRGDENLAMPPPKVIGEALDAICDLAERKIFENRDALHRAESVLGRIEEIHTDGCDTYEDKLAMGKLAREYLFPPNAEGKCGDAEPPENQKPSSGSSVQSLVRRCVTHHFACACRENRFKELLEDTIRSHSTPDNANYNECDKEPCAWCEEANALIYHERVDGVFSQPTIITPRPGKMNIYRVIRDSDEEPIEMASPSSPCCGSSERFNANLRNFAIYWELDGDILRCRKCGRGVIASRADKDMIHAGDCEARLQVRPWEKLRGMTIAVTGLPDNATRQPMNQ